MIEKENSEKPLSDIEVTDAIAGTSLKNQSLWSSKKTLENLEKNYETRKTIKTVKNFYSSL